MGKVKKYFLGENIVEYIIHDEKHIVMNIIPAEMEKEVIRTWDLEEMSFNPEAEYTRSVHPGNLVYCILKGDDLEYPGYTMKSKSNLTLKSHEFIKETDGAKIVTVMTRENGCEIEHTLTYKNGYKGFICNTKFLNNSYKTVVLDMLSSFALDDLSPFQSDDAPNKYKFHRFYGGWSLEGKHICQPIEELCLEKAWAGYAGNNEKFGSKGSYPVKRYFPAAAFEDSEKGVVWAVQLTHNATWQMELTRNGDYMSFTGGLGDREFCGWRKEIKPGESFEAPAAYIASVKGDIDDACYAVTDMQKIAWRAYGEKGLPVAFNEYCTSWGKPTQEKMLSYCDALKDKGVKYIVIDAGWCKQGCEQDANGEWNIDKNIFPDMKEMNRIIRSKGMIPGVWFEFEVTTKGSVMFESDYDYMHLQKDGKVLKSDGWRSYWDFRREDVREYLYEKVIKMLKDNDFGYIKVDYNNNIGLGVDGAESEAEGLRAHLEEVRKFFIRMKQEIPDLVIENCASGGHRLEPSMIGVSAVSSFSDCHEAKEIPYVAANLHRLMLPAQSLIWAVLHDTNDDDRLMYSLAAGFLGRLCLSGDIDKLSDAQYKIFTDAIDFYKKCEAVLIDGKTKICGNRGKNMRYAEGTQAVVRKTDEEILIVCHSFKNASENFEIEVGNSKIKATFGNDFFELKDSVLTVKNTGDYKGGAVLLKRI